MTRPKLIDADKLRDQLLMVASNFHSPMYYNSSYETDGMKGALVQLDYQIKQMVNEAITQSVRTALQNIAFQLDSAATTEYGCILCRPSEHDREPPPHPLTGRVFDPE